MEFVREIAREENLSFKVAVITSDMPRDVVKRARREGRISPLGRIDELTEERIDSAAHIVGQMGSEAFKRALETEPDVIIAGRACDTAIFSSIPEMLGYSTAAAVHMAKIIECTSICCTPGGRDAMLAELKGDAFSLESMNPQRAATPLSVAAHSLYEQADPLRVYEPAGMLDVSHASFSALDERRALVSGASWHPSGKPTVKIEGAEWCGERSVLCAASCDPQVIAHIDEIIAASERRRMRSCAAA